MKNDQETLFNVILAANYLDIKGLLNVSCWKVGDMIRGKTAEQIRQHFNIKADLPDQDQQ